MAPPQAPSLETGTVSKVIQFVTAFLVPSAAPSRVSPSFSLPPTSLSQCQTGAGTTPALNMCLVCHCLEGTACFPMERSPFWYLPYPAAQETYQWAPGS